MKSVQNNEKKPVSKKSAYKLLLIIILCVIIGGAYFAILDYEEEAGLKNSIVMQVYAYTDAVLVIAFLVLNSGLSSSVPTVDMIDESVPREKAKKFVEGINKRKRYAKPLLFLIIPLTFTLFADIMLLFWGDMVTALFKSIFSSIKT